MQKKIMIYTTFPDIKTGCKIINALLKEKLIACGNIFKIDSQYRWQDKIEKTVEYAAFLKTKASLYKKVESYIKKKHPYKVPAIIALKIEKGLLSYLNWINKETLC